MIVIKLYGHDFRYELEEIIKLFYKPEEITFLENEPPGEYRGIFLLSAVSKTNEIVTRLESNGEVLYSNEHSLQIESKSELEIRKFVKREVNRQAYIALSKFTQKQMPWGMLVGIRPAKIVHELLDKGWSKEEILTRLNEYYCVSNQKAELVFSVAQAERDILGRTSRNMIGIYIGIPFCTTRCLYCSFTSNPISRYSGMVKGYIDALKAEIDGVSEIIRKKAYKIQTIYIGGGTPTSIQVDYLKELLEYIEQSFDLNVLEEYTLEAGRPDTMDRDRLEVIKQSKVNRISINPQTMNEETLRAIGRSHTPQDIVNAFYLAREIGFDNINMDVIAGLPGESLDMFQNTLSEIGKLRPESLTVHTMSVKRASKLNEEKEKYNLTSGNEVTGMVDMAYEYAQSMMMYPYYLYRQKNILGNLENIGYCKKGFESVYNVQIMEEKQTIIALGAGAITKVVYTDENRIERAFNVKNVEEYIKRLDEMLERKKVLLCQGDGFVL